MKGLEQRIERLRQSLRRPPRTEEQKRKAERDAYGRLRRIYRRKRGGKVGRPKKAPAEKRSKRVVFYLTPMEKELLDLLSEAAQTTPGIFCHRLVRRALKQEWELGTIEEHRKRRRKTS